MTVSIQTPYKAAVAAPGATTFPSDFRAILAGDVGVAVNGVVQTTGFTLSGLGNASGFNVIFTTPMVGGELVEIQRRVPLSRATDYQQLGSFPAAVVNVDLDRLWMAIQDAGFVNALAVLLPVGDAQAPMTIPSVADRASKFLAFDALGKAIAAAGASGVPVSTFIATLLDDIDAAAARNTLGAAASGLIGSSGLTMNTARMLWRNTAGVGQVEEATAAQVRTFLTLASIATSGSAADLTTGDVPAARLATVLNASGSAPMFVTRAWANFNGSTGAIRASGNVSSVTRNGAGLYTVTLTTAMADTNYTIKGDCSSTTAGRAATLGSDNATAVPTTTTFRLIAVDHAGTPSHIAFDPTYAHFHVIR